ncbi:MAG: hypothetical protein DRH57_09105 [Candidatus Cloacimonadota bacterium]|nr:MAG: hypothetical protein DRH57_09105 [Candidatus Cloacimonadota bacterium]
MRRIMKISLVFIILFVANYGLLGADPISELEKKIIKVYEKISPNVVKVKVTTKVKNRWISNEITGCGLILGDNNYILTNKHIANEDNIKEIKVYFNEKDNPFEAEIVGTDELQDLVLIKVDSLPVRVKPIKWIDMDKVKIGQFVIAIGDPFGLGGTITFGIISKVKRDIPTYEINPYIQSDIITDIGSSGGPLVNLKGEIVGINSKSTGTHTLSIPADIVQESIEKMKKGNVVKPYTGINYNLLQQKHRDFFQNDSLNGIIVVGFGYKSTAKEEGVQCGDIIIAVNGNKISGKLENAGTYYRRLINEIGIDSKAYITIWRFGKIFNIEVPLINEPEKGKREVFECKNWGFTVKELSDKLIFDRTFADSVQKGNLEIVDIDDKSDAGRVLREGWVIKGLIDGYSEIPINTLDNIKELYEKYKDNKLVMLKVITSKSVHYPILEKYEKDLESLESRKGLFD